MELRHLSSFAATAELQSFTRAAESLGVTQAAVSQHVAALEKELRVSLFRRSGRTITLTDAGRDLHQYARRILDLVEQARSEVGGISAAVRGSLEIGTSTVPSESLLPDLLTRFRQAHPQVRESVRISDSTAALRSVESGETDLGFVGELPKSRELLARPVVDDELVLVVAPGHRFAESGRIAPGKLRGEPLILREPESGSRHCIEQALQDAGLSTDDLNVALEVNSNDAIRRAVEQGVGAAFLSRVVVGREIADGTLIEVAVDGVCASRQLYLVRRADRLPTPAVRAFLSVVEDWLADTRSSGAETPARLHDA